MKYKEAHEQNKAHDYTIVPDGVNFINYKKVNQIVNDVRPTTLCLFFGPSSSVNQMGSALAAPSYHIQG